MAAPSQKNKPVQREGNPVTLAYLIAYNVAQIMGWSAIFIAMAFHLFSEWEYKGLYIKVAPLLNVFQTAAVLEIIHCAVGMVRSNVVLTAFQVFSRVFLTWGIAHSVPVVQDYLAVTLFLTAWSITEMVRYSFYMFALIGEVPYPIKWCRYTLFIALYPIGVTGELLAILNSLEFVRTSKLYSVDMPNILNMSFNYYYFLIIIMVSYIPVFPQLYMHMIAQRKKVIGGGDKKKTE